MKKTEQYKLIRTEWLNIVDSSTPWDTRLSTLVALIKTHNSAVSWVGAYLNSNGDGTLWVNCYQGPVACIRIAPGRGVCGKSFADQKTIIVTDVHKFPDHIACDSKSRSEIVVPISKNGEIIGVLDLDSHSLSAFDEADRTALEDLLKDL